MAKTKFVTINSIVMLADKSLLWSSIRYTIEPFPSYHYAATLAVGYTG